MKTFNISNLLNVPDLPDYIKLVEEELDNVLQSEHDFIRNPILRLIKSKSKRLRPSLLVAIVASKGLKIDKKIITSCVALELVHIASLVHDDIIDHSDTRWGVSTINSKEGINHAIMIGDFLFAKANQQAAKVSLEVATIISNSIQYLCEGEMLEMEDEFNQDRKIKDLLKTIEGKTAALISATCQIAGYCAELSINELKSLDLYGKHFGTSFQFIDDILDFLSTEEILGKPVGNDVAEGVFNLPILLSINDGENIKSWLDKGNNKNYQELVEKLISNGSIQRSIILVHEYNKLAVDEIKYFTNDHIRDSLSKLPDAYMKWALNNLVNKKFNLQITKYLKELKYYPNSIDINIAL